ncbi:MAG: FkbM family methyltransferase [Actinomycetota bacterium]|nr:FkbM family methyltransferase [Actinomycetota bacterium]
MNFNKACEIEDFSDPELAATIREICDYKLGFFPPEFPLGAEYNKDWEVAMAVRALRKFGALTPDSMVLGVAAGQEDTLFFLTRHCRMVFATDRYLDASEWSPVAPVTMLVEPAPTAPVAFDPHRLVVQHMDGRSLRFPDGFFDGIFSSGSIEHFGGLEDVAAAAYEMGRVLKRGGLLSISTVFRCGGTAEGPGFPGTLVMSPEELRRYILAASGLELVDDLQLEVSEATLATERRLAEVLAEKDERRVAGGRWAEVPDYALWDFPHLILEHDGYVFDSVHLALRKTDAYPVVENEWAKPGARTIDSIRQYNESALERHLAPPPEGAQSEPGPAEGIEATPAPAAQDAAAAPAVQDAAAWLPRVEECVEELASLRAKADDLSDGRLLPYIPGGWRAVPVEIPGGLRFELFIDPEMKDPITHAYFWGQGHHVDPDLVRLMLALVEPEDVVVDLGSFLGTFSLAAAAAGCKVLAVDASAQNAALLRASVARNGFQRVRVVQAAVGDSPGEISFVPHGPWGHAAMEGAAGETVVVPALRVDDVLSRLGWETVAFVKMDVEGSEIKALRGLSGVFGGPAAPPILYESNSHTLRFYGLTTRDLIGEFERFGYRSYLVEPGRLIKTTATELQPQTVVNYLAVKGPNPKIPGWIVEGAMSFEERVSKLVAESEFPHEDHRASVAHRLEKAPPNVLEDPLIAQALDRLSRDSSEAVRKSAEWWRRSEPEIR